MYCMFSNWEQCTVWNNNIFAHFLVVLQRWEKITAAKMESLFGSEWEEIMNIFPLQGPYVKTGLATCLSWLDHKYLFTINGPFLGPIAKSYIVL